VPSIRDIDDRQAVSPLSLCTGKKGESVPFFDTDTRISEECPMAIHRVELRLRGGAAVQMLGPSSTQAVPRCARVLD